MMQLTKQEGLAKFQPFLKISDFSSHGTSTRNFKFLLRVCILTLVLILQK